MVTWAMRCRTGSATTKCILIVIADQARDDGYSQPDAGDIRRFAECSDDTIARHAAKLEKARLLTRQRIRDHEGKWTPWEYLLVGAPGAAQSFDDLPPRKMRTGPVQAAQDPAPDDIEDVPPSEPSEPSRRRPPRNVRRQSATSQAATSRATPQRPAATPQPADWSHSPPEEDGSPLQTSPLAAATLAGIRRRLSNANAEAFDADPSVGYVLTPTIASLVDRGWQPVDIARRLTRKELDTADVIGRVLAARARQLLQAPLPDASPAAGDAAPDCPTCHGSRRTAGRGGGADVVDCPDCTGAAA